jgi:hypothetical protein
MRLLDIDPEDADRARAGRSALAGLLIGVVLVGVMVVAGFGVLVAWAMSQFAH